MPQFKPEALPGILELLDCNITALYVNILSLKGNHIKETEAFWKQTRKYTNKHPASISGTILL